LLRVARELEARHPELFAGFRPLDDAELRAACRPRTERGASDAHCIAPRGKILEARPTFVARSDSSQLQLTRADGTIEWHAPLGPPDADGTRRAAYPAERAELAPGRVYLWSVVDPAGLAFCTADFEIAGAQESERFVAARACIEREAPAALRDVLVAHLALRFGLVAEASRAASAAGDRRLLDTLAPSP
jgi:hypothetical protein